MKVESGSGRIRRLSIHSRGDFGVRGEFGSLSCRIEVRSTAELETSRNESLECVSESRVVKSGNSRCSVSIDRFREICIVNRSNDWVESVGPEGGNLGRRGDIANEGKGKEEMLDEVAEDWKFSRRNRFLVRTVRNSPNQSLYLSLRKSNKTYASGALNISSLASKF